MFLDVMVENLSRSISRQEEALKYLHSRHVSDEDIKNYRIGCSKVVSVPEDNHSDRDRFLIESARGRKFDGKIIFPICDMMDRVLGIAGRSIQSKEFKNFITNEGKFVGFFFGLYQALPYIYSKNRVYVVEGYFDCLAFRKIFPNTVASMTAGLSVEQHALLKMFCDSIVTVFDSDEAGRIATEEAKGMDNSIQSFEVGYKDPANCLETLGLQSFNKYILRKSQEILF
jgi:DNA primase